MRPFNRNFLIVFVLATFVLAGYCEKEPVDESENAKTEASMPSVRGHVFERSEFNDGKTSQTLADLGFLHAFIASVSVIVVSELGDKTFFIAAIMAMRHPRLTVFLGAIAALAFMTVISAVFGWVATVIPRAYTYYISTALFAIFGLKMLKDGYYMSPNEGQEELEEVQSDIRKKEEELKKADDRMNEVEEDLVVQRDSTPESEGPSRQKEVVIDPTQLNLEGLSALPLEACNDATCKKPEYEKEVASGMATDVETGISFSSMRKKLRLRAGSLSAFSRVFIQSFTLTFLAEWGDRSQLTTIILAAREDVVGVTVGGVLGHSMCTGLAVLGGRMIAQRISVRTVTLIGGVVFLVFAFSAFFFDPNAES